MVFLLLMALISAFAKVEAVPAAAKLKEKVVPQEHAKEPAHANIDDNANVNTNAHNVVVGEDDELEEMEMEIEGTALEGGSLDEAIDAGKPLGMPVEAVEKHTQESPRQQQQHHKPDANANTMSSSDSAVNVKDQVKQILKEMYTTHSPSSGRGMFCNDQKIGVSLSDAVGFVLPSSDAFASIVDAVTKLVESDADATGNDTGAALKGMRERISTAFDAAFSSQDMAYDIAGTIKSSLQAVSSLGSNVARTEVPVTALISDGEFLISGVQEPSSIQLIQRNYALVNTLCGLDISTYLGPLRSTLCACWFGSDADADADVNVNRSQEWCVVKDICENHGSCTVQVDPFRAACIAYAPGALGSVSYDRRIPSIDIGSTDFQTTFGALGKWIDKKVNIPFGFEFSLHYVGGTVDYLGQYIPTYLFRMLVGLWLLSVADELSSNILFQYVLAAVFGVLLAIIWVLLVVYRTAEGLVKNSMPMFLPGLGVAVLGPIWYVLSQNYIRSMVLTGLVGFWRDGWGPYHNAGKLYFSVSMLLSITLKHYFGLFTPKSNSGYVLKTLIKGMGCLLLFYCTSNRELSSLFLLYGLLQEYVLYVWFRVRLAHEVSNQKSSAQMMGRPLYTQAELSKLSEDTTKRELEKLRLKLLSNPEYTGDLKNKLRLGEKGEQATMLSRFLNGAYHLAATPLVPGTPGYAEAGLSESMDDDEDNHMIDTTSAANEGSRSGSGRSWFSTFWGRLLFLAVGFIVIAGLGMAFQRNQTMQLYQHISSVTTASAPHVIKGLTALNALAKQAGGIAIEKIQGR